MAASSCSSSSSPVLQLRSPFSLHSLLHPPHFSSSSLLLLRHQPQPHGFPLYHSHHPFFSPRCSSTQTLSVAATLSPYQALNPSVSAAKLSASPLQSSAFCNGFAAQRSWPLAARPCRKALWKQDVRVQASTEPVEVDERIIAALAYLLPFLDGVHYGRFLFSQFPATQALLQPFLPLLHLYKDYPFASFVVFFTFYLVVVRNPNFSRYVRFNTMQAVVLDVLLIIPSLLERGIPVDGGMGYDLLVNFYNTVFLYLLACFVFGFGSCLLGKIPRLPLVADAADAQVF